MLLLLVAGVSLTASAVTWWNGRRTASVQREIEKLEADREHIKSADASDRRTIIEGYLRRIDAVIDQEIGARNDIYSELITCLAKARAIEKNRFGSRESGAFKQAVLELELALSRVNAERAYLAIMKSKVKDGLYGIVCEVPSPASLDVPSDFPRSGAFLHFDEGVPAEIHGYRLSVTDWSKDLEGRAILYEVNHDERIARVSTARCALLEANLLDGGGPMLATVLRRDRDGVHLEYEGAPLLLPRDGGREYSWLYPELEVEVFPEIWTLDEVMRFGADEPLRVRIHSRVEGSRKCWSPILLSVSEDQLPELVRADQIISRPSLSDSPWRVHLLDSGELGFTLGEVTLVTRPDFEQRAFVFDRLTMESLTSDIWVRIYACLCAFVPGTEDDAAADRTLFESFVEALHAELSSQKRLLIQRRSAFRLRKLSLIYQDQEDHLRATGSCGFIPIEAHRGGRVVTGAITAHRPPPWLDDSLSSDLGPRLQAVGRETAWEVRRAMWKDRRLGICSLELATPEEASFHEIDPLHIKRLELVGEGSQQQTLSKSLERTILGKFTSGVVHSTLLGVSGEEVENRAFGVEAVKELLASDAEVVAIWGPPGTGKTTTLVQWLVSLFPIGRELEWPSVLMSAPTHVAVSKLLTDTLSKGGWLSESAVRYCSAERIQGTQLEPVWHRRLLEHIDRKQNRVRGGDGGSVERWARVLATREGRESAAKWVLGRRHIHAVTCVGMDRREFSLNNRSFDIAIVDEAGKAFGAELLIPAAVARRVIMVGDHNQLPPTVTKAVLDERIGYRLSMSEVEELLQRNMFREFFEQLPEQNKGMLTLQYRMHEDIGSLVSQLFYDGNLQSHRKGGEWTLTSRRVVLVDFTQVESYRNRASMTSQENPIERTALHAILHRLRDRNGGVVKRLLVICPYKAQRDAVAKEVSDQLYGFSVDATTVDAVQGDEAELVVLLMTRSGGRVHFLLDRHRLNVALSRAREAVIILGHLGCLAPDDSSPFADLVKFGMQADTLDLIRLPKTTSKREVASIASRVVP